MLRVPDPGRGRFPVHAGDKTDASKTAPPGRVGTDVRKAGFAPPEGSQRSTALHRRFGPLSVPRVVVTGALILLGVWAVGSVFWTGLSSYHQPPGKGAPEDGFWGQGPFLRLSLLDRAEAEPAKQALEAVKGAGTIHFVNRSSGVVAGIPEVPQGESQVAYFLIEVWLAGEERYRQETTCTYPTAEGAKELKTIQVRNGDRMWRYESTDHRVVFTEGESKPTGPVRRTLNIAQKAAEFLASYKDGATDPRAEKVTGPEGSLYVITYHPQGNPASREVFYIEVESQQLIAFEKQHLVMNGWEPTVRCDVLEYDEEIPESTFVFQPPPGVKVVKRTWWKERRSQVLAQKTQGAWDLMVHSIDVADNGNVFLSLSYQHVAECQCRPPGGGLPSCWMEDEHGHPYAHLRGTALAHIFSEGRRRTMQVFTPVDPQEARKAPPTQFTVAVDICPHPSSGKPLSDCAMKFEKLPARYLPQGVYTPNPVSGDPVTEERRKKALENYWREQAVQEP